MSKEQYYKTNLSNTTTSRRQQIKNLQDEFMTFSWGGVDAFDRFGAFIINENKGSLKFYNGPGFSNEYTKPQFDNNGGDLMGVTFNRQTISFTIGVYWISIEDYRLLLNWLHPLKVDFLQFGFNKEYRYNVKLSKIGDSTRYIVGKEDNDYRYYTELSLTFEMQGTPCAIGTHSYEWKNWTTLDGHNFSTSIEKRNEFIESDLPTPLIVSFEFKLEGDQTLNQKEHTVILNAKYGDSILNLFTITLKNLTFTPAAENNKPLPLVLNLTYYSETGLLFLKYGNSNERLLNLLNTADTGEKIVQSFTVNKFFLPGQFNYNSFRTEDFSLMLDSSKLTLKSLKKDDEIYYPAVIECYPRTNVI